LIPRSSLNLKKPLNPGAPEDWGLLSLGLTENAVADTPNLQDALANSAASPRAGTVQGMGSFEDHPLTDQRDIAKFLPPGNARRRVGGGMRFAKGVAGGAVE
jgi:hypothetical protein